MPAVTDTFHLQFDTRTYPGKIQCVRITINRDISGDPGKKYRHDLCEHPLYQALHEYCKNNPPRSPK